MVNAEQPPDPVRALEFKEKGNKCFQAGDYQGAEGFYTQAISHDPTNPLLYTNRAMALLKLSHYESVISDSLTALSLHPNNMKAHFQLAQAQIALHHEKDALESAKKAYELCMEEVMHGGKGATSLGPIMELVRRCRKEVWEGRERERTRTEKGLLGELVRDLEDRRDVEVQRLEGESAGEIQIEEVRQEYEGKIESLRGVFHRAGEVPRRRVPDWCIDDITFAVMDDPVVTKTGQSYDRSSIMEHLKRSPTDPLTREPLHVSDLRPNLALREACEEFLEENGWAVDW
ncbi:related to CHIP protein (carboxyl terminus of Hsc70-interacting protein) [Phialocephala subalpina]|uniref:Related to CHIP protein (Carboxyl terminus of Hsc70-interacting protein) n=1 Tax=Phialocephala subalpina TaxID=576137 RepID=A0A1L7XC14_9HELO|nr:related to CHIP protein (carboxyl terminus of Hsc70-interacting protein) [Phialocephala subalpina]